MKEPDQRIVEINGVPSQLSVDAKLQASVLRALTGTTPLDTEVDATPVPQGPYWLRQSIGLLRWYRSRVSPNLGQRCVYEPSCSRYSELSLTKHGFVKGVVLTVKRLYRCRPGAGGIDLP
jgi:putative membrane protein insertion efficiency factor